MDELFFIINSNKYKAFLFAQNPYFSHEKSNTRSVIFINK